MSGENPNPNPNSSIGKQKENCESMDKGGEGSLLLGDTNKSDEQQQKEATIAKNRAYFTRVKVSYLRKALEEELRGLDEDESDEEDEEITGPPPMLHTSLIGYSVIHAKNKTGTSDYDSLLPLIRDISQRYRAIRDQGPKKKKTKVQPQLELELEVEVESS